MTDTARLHLLPDTREDTQRMAVEDRRYRQTEARTQLVQGLGWQWREPFERLPTTQTEIYEQCYAKLHEPIFTPAVARGCAREMMLGDIVPDWVWDTAYRDTQPEWPFAQSWDERARREP